MKTTKTILILFLFVAICVPLAIPIILQLKISLLKMEALEKLERSNLQTRHIKIKDIYWTEPGKEMVIDNRLFDVKEFKASDTGIIVIGLFDDEESALVKEIHIHWNQQNTRQGNFLLKYFQFINNGYFLPNSYELQAASLIHGSFITEVIFYEKDVFLKIPSPPPQA